MNNRDRYEIIGLHKILHSIKQPCSSVWPKKAFEMHQSCTLFINQKIEYFDLQAFEISNFA